MVLPTETSGEIRRAGFGRLVALARMLNLVSAREQAALKELTDLRNRLAHGWKTEPAVTDEDVDRLWKAFKLNPIPSCADMVEILRHSHVRLASVLGHIGADMREKQRVLEKLLPEIRQHQERLSLLHSDPGVVRQLSKEEWDFLAR